MIAEILLYFAGNTIYTKYPLFTLIGDLLSIDHYGKDQGSLYVQLQLQCSIPYRLFLPLFQFLLFPDRNALLLPFPDHRLTKNVSFLFLYKCKLPRNTHHPGIIFPGVFCAHPVHQDDTPLQIGIGLSGIWQLILISHASFRKIREMKAIEISCEIFSRCRKQDPLFPSLFCRNRAQIRTFSGCNKGKLLCQLPMLKILRTQNGIDMIL